MSMLDWYADSGLGADVEQLPWCAWNFANVTEMRYFLATTTATQSLAREKGVDEEMELPRFGGHLIWAR
jgi:hypothetical protein